MISFIIIGLNEGLKLNKCFESIINTIDNSQLYHDAEIIYVDSKSTDGSYENALLNNKVKSYRLEGKCNPAIARNFGAKKARGDIFCFLDGDMELLSGKLEKLFTEDGELINPLMTANRIDVFYDTEGNYIGTNEEEKVNLVDNLTITTGGMILIKKELWRSVNGMDESLRCFEDNDLAYRVFKKHKLKVLKSKEILVKHHTVRYTDNKRYQQLIFSNFFLYRGKLYRKHLFFPRIVFIMMKSDLSLLILSVSIIATILSKNPFFLLFYFVAVLIKLLFITKHSSNIPSFKRYYLDIVKDCKIITGFFFKK